MIDCNNCRHINMTETEQVDKRRHHICLKYSRRIFHNANILKSDRKLEPCWNCWNDNYVNYKVR